MIDPDRRLGPWRLRSWGLVVNFVGNAMALFGMVAFVERGSIGLLAAGVAITALCVAVLAIPSRGS